MKNNLLVTTLALDLALFTSVMIFSAQSFLLVLINILIAALLLSAKREDWKLFVSAVIFAIIMEPLAVHFGAWVYPNSDILGVPYWIFLMWGVSAVSVYRVGLYLTGGKL